MRRLTALPGVARSSLALAVALALSLAACDRAPTTQPQTEDVSPPMLAGGPPTGEVAVQVTLLDEPGGAPVMGHWLVTFLTTDGDNSDYALTTNGIASFNVTAPATGCIVARPVNTLNDPIYSGQIPLVWPTVSQVTVEDPGVTDYGAVVSWTDPDGEVIGAPAFRWFILDCLSSPSYSFDRNDGNGPDPDVAVELVVPPGRTVDVTFKAPQANGTTEGETLVPEALAIVPLPRAELSPLSSNWTSGLDDDQNVGIVISANAGEELTGEETTIEPVTLVVPQYPSGWPYDDPDPVLPCSSDPQSVADECTEQEAPPIVIEQNLEPDGAGSFFTSTYPLTSTEISGAGLLSITAPAFYTMCSIQEITESDSDGGAIEFMGDPNTHEGKVFYGYQAKEENGNTASNQDPEDSNIVPITHPWAIGAWWWQRGTGSITLQIRNIVGGTTENLNLPISCTEDGCSAGEKSMWSGSLTAFDVKAAVSFQLVSDPAVSPPTFKLVASVTGLPYEKTQLRWNTSGDQIPDASLRGKSSKVEEAYGALQSPPSECGAFLHNDDRWFAR